MEVKKKPCLKIHEYLSLFLLIRKILFIIDIKGKIVVVANDSVICTIYKLA